MTTTRGREKPAVTDGQQPTAPPFEPKPAALAMALAFAELEPIRRQWIQAGPAKFKALKIDDVYDAVRTVMARHGIWPYARLDSHETSQRGEKPVTWRYDLTAYVVVQSADGSEVVTGPWPARGDNTQDKSISVALSYLMKTALIAMFVIPGASEDPDENGPGETHAEDRQAGRSGKKLDQRRRQELPEGWADRETFVAEVRALYDRVKALGEPGRTVVSRFMDELGYDLVTLTEEQFQAVQAEVDRLEAGGSADRATGEHNDRHEPTDDHQHDPEVVPVTVGYAQHPDPGTDDHWHPAAHGPADEPHDWQHDERPHDAPF